MQKVTLYMVHFMAFDLRSCLHGGRKILVPGRSEKADNFFFALDAEISAEVVTKWTRKRRVTVGLEQLNTRLPPCSFCP